MAKKLNPNSAPILAFLASTELSDREKRKALGSAYRQVDKHIRKAEPVEPEQPVEQPPEVLRDIA